MNNSVNLQIVRVNLTSKFWQSFVAVMGVTFGVSMYIFMNSFMNGVNKTQDDLAFSALPHIRIFNQENNHEFDPIRNRYGSNTLIHISNKKRIQYSTGLRNVTSVIEKVSANNQVAAVTPQINFSVFFRSGSKKINGRISGIQLQSEDDLFNTSSTITEGSWEKLSTHKSGIIVGNLLAKDLDLSLNNNINVLTSDGTSKNYIVVGIFESSLKDIDKSKAYLSLESSRQLLGHSSDYATDVLLNVHDRDESIVVAQQLSSVIPFQIESWQEANEQLLAGESLRTIIAIAVSITILLVAGFGIYNIMNMTINEKIKEIAILKATGFSGGDIKWIFLSHSAIIGVFGGITGIILGYCISLIVNNIPFNVANLEHLPIAFRVEDYFLAILFGVLTTLLAGYLPASKAARVDPVEIIRG
jgi:lipoprotein-releasing system permease protein